ncbi:MAG TPA: zeta toxin family protein [Patescibacteria group bacterium]|nr:zeta toxin family protein [Patescibacteria group bacterium]
MNNISDESFRFAKKHKKEIIKKFISDDIKSNNKPVFIFMAGAPGAGKTEWSQKLIKILEKRSLNNGIVRIDADEIRNIFRPLGYNGKNSDKYKRGCIKGIEILFDNCVKNKYHTIIDGTFSSIGVVQKNIKSALKINANIFIVYVYQDPLIAWGFTKIRERDEGRKIKKDMFINSLFKSILNVNIIKKEYKKKVEVWLVEKDISNTKTKNIKFNIDNIDNYLKLKYNRKTLNELIYEKENEK